MVVPAAVALRVSTCLAGDVLRERCPLVVAVPNVRVLEARRVAALALEELKERLQGAILISCPR